MKTCPNCGKSVEDHAGFCGYCGASQPAAEPQTPPAFCPNCGERVEAGNPFCPNCGASLTPKPAPAPKGAKTNRLIGMGLVAAVVIAVAVLAVTVLPNLFKSDADRFVDYQEELFAQPMFAMMETAVNAAGEAKFSSDLTLTAKVDDRTINSYLKDSSVLLKVDAKADSAIVNGELTVMGSKLLTGTVTYDRGVLGFYLPEADDTYYTVDLKELLYDLGLDMELENLELPDVSGKEVRALIEDYLDIAASVITKDNLKVEKGKTVRYATLGGRFEGAVYTFMPEAEDLEEMIGKLADHLEGDKKLRKLIMEVLASDAFAAVLEEEGIDLDDFEDDLDDAIYDLADRLRDQAEDIGEAVEDAGFTWTLAMEGKNVRQIYLYVTDRWGEQGILYEAKGMDSDGMEQALVLVEDGDQQVVMEHSYTRKGKNLEGEMTIHGYPDVTLEYEMDLGKVSPLGVPYGTYELTVGGESVELEVTAGAGKSTDHTLTVKADPYNFDYMFSKLEITLNATEKGSAKKPDAKHTEDITDYSNRELSELFEDLSESLSDELEDALYDLLGVDVRYGW